MDVKRSVGSYTPGLLDHTTADVYICGFMNETFLLADISEFCVFLKSVCSGLYMHVYSDIGWWKRSSGVGYYISPIDRTYMR